VRDDEIMSCLVTTKMGIDICVTIDTSDRNPASDNRGIASVSLYCEHETPSGRKRESYKRVS
jgi:hypothetical protein